MIGTTNDTNHLQEIAVPAFADELSKQFPGDTLPPMGFRHIYGVLNRMTIRWTGSKGTRISISGDHALGFSN